MGKRFDIEEVEKFIEENSSCKLVSKEYVNRNAKLTMICNCGNEFKTSFKSFRVNNKRQCDKCGIDNRKKN